MVEIRKRKDRYYDEMGKKGNDGKKIKLRDRFYEWGNRNRKGLWGRVEKKRKGIFNEKRLWIRNVWNK